MKRNIKTLCGTYLYHVIKSTEYLIAHLRRLTVAHLSTKSITVCCHITSLLCESTVALFSMLKGVFLVYSIWNVKLGQYPHIFK